MKTEVQEQIKKEFDERATDSAFECSFYTRDLAPVPDFLVDPLFKTRPDMVVRPQNTAEVAQIPNTSDTPGRRFHRIFQFYSYQGWNPYGPESNQGN